MTMHAHLYIRMFKRHTNSQFICNNSKLIKIHTFTRCLTVTLNSNSFSIGLRSPCTILIVWDRLNPVLILIKKDYQYKIIIMTILNHLNTNLILKMNIANSLNFKWKKLLRKNSVRKKSNYFMNAEMTKI
jgi:hypothetical protein